MVNPFTAIVENLENLLSSRSFESFGNQGTLLASRLATFTEGTTSLQLELAQARGQETTFSQNLLSGDTGPIISLPSNNTLTTIIIIGAVIVGASLLFSRGKK